MPGYIQPPFPRVRALQREEYDPGNQPEAVTREPDIERKFELFYRQHQARLEETKARLPLTARRVLEVLPLLLHYNVESLPGYVADAPRGIRHYTPCSDAFSAARNLAISYRPDHHIASPQEILGVYLMGSSGSVAQTRSSDIDVWVCAPVDKCPAIQTKLARITRWADRLGIELQAFAVHPDQFDGGVDIASSPLLLDEFYRTACYIAGQYPIWWLISPDSSAVDYRREVNNLVNARAIHADSFVDFGPVPVFEPAELFAAGVRELTAALHAPYKALLKLALLETYVQGSIALSDRYKTLVLASDDGLELDPYLLLADHVDEHLAADEAQLRFFHHAWLTKTARGNARLIRNPAWLQRASQWHYGLHEIEHLRWPMSWLITDYLAESRRLSEAYEHAIRFLDRLRDQFSSSGSNARTEIGYLHTRATIEGYVLAGRIFPALRPQASDGIAEIIQTAQGWQLKEAGRTLFTHTRLVGVVLWLSEQGFELSCLAPQLRSNPRLKQIFSALQQSQVAVIFNAEYESREIDTLLAADFNPLSYGRHKVNLIRTVDIVYAAQHGELTHREVSSASLVTALQHLLSNPRDAFACIGDLRRNVIEHRVRQLLEEARSALAEGSTFITELGQGWMTLSASSPECVEIFESHSEALLLATCPPSSAVTLHRGTRLPSIDTSQLIGPTLWINPKDDAVELIFRDKRRLQRIISPKRSASDFGRSMKLFLTLLARRGIEVPQLGPEVDSKPAEQSDLLRFPLCLRQTQHGWEVQIEQDVYQCAGLTAGLIRGIRTQVLYARSADTEYPIYLTDIELHSRDFLDHLLAKIRIERLLTPHRSPV